MSVEGEHGPHRAEEAGQKVIKAASLAKKPLLEGTENGETWVCLVSRIANLAIFS